MSINQKIFSISISYPPLDSTKGTPFLSQNRQFQWTNTGNVILPVIPAYAATVLHQNGFKVFWDDAIAENLSYQSWLNRIIKHKPSLLAIETKTPVVKQHWKIINELKRKSLEIRNWKLKIVLMGDHVTALPIESLKKSHVDFIITGGDYDFMLLNLVNHLVNKTKLEPGFYYRYKDHIVNTGKFALIHHNLDTLPIIDRDLINWKLYAYHNTNYKYFPGAYIMSGRDCWWGKCTFCSWTTTHPFGTFRNFSVDHTIKEIRNLVENFGIKEVFDDTGTFPTGKWLDDFCLQMIQAGLNKKVVLGCNMRFSALNQQQYDLMKQAGFRFILYGLESANQKTLDRICKNTNTSDAIKTLLIAKRSGLEPHITVMIGYPWETKSDAQKTINLARQIFRECFANSLQATIIIPYPGTPLFKDCDTKGLLLTKDWDNYDMRQPIMKTAMTPLELNTLIQSLFIGVISPKFLLNQVVSIRSLADIKHLLNYAIKYLQKLKDFPVNEN